jgi:hypothetical protein
MLHKNIPDHIRTSFERSALWPSAATMHAFTKGELAVNAYWEDRLCKHLVMGLASGPNVLYFCLTEATGVMTVATIDRSLASGHNSGSTQIGESKNSKYLLRSLQNKNKGAGENLQRALASARLSFNSVLNNVVHNWNQRNCNFPLIDTTLSHNALQLVLDVYFGRAQALDMPETINHKLVEIDKSFDKRRECEAAFRTRATEMFAREKWLIIYRRMWTTDSFMPPQIIIGGVNGHQLNENVHHRAFKGSELLGPINWTVEPQMYYGYENIDPNIVDNIMARLTMMRRLRDASHPEAKAFKDPERFFADATWIELPSINAITAEGSAYTSVILMDK